VVLWMATGRAEEKGSYCDCLRLFSEDKKAFGATTVEEKTMKKLIKKGNKTKGKGEKS
jgi:hypothetical protein